MRRANPVVGLFIILAGLALLSGWLGATRQAAPTVPIDDIHLKTALDFAHAVYVKDWDGSPWRFHQASRDEDGSYRLRNKGWKSSLAFIRLSGTWNLYFNEITSGNRSPQDAQILTGSRMEPGGKIAFVVAFRGSDKPEDFLFTNCRNFPIAWEGSITAEHWRAKERNYIMEPFYISVISMIFDFVVTWISNLLPSSPVFAHQGYAEQVFCALSAKIVDPVDGTYLTIVEALKKYPAADYIITGHSSGGSAAHIMSAYAWEMGLNRENRIHTRTFAAAGSFNYAGQIKYSKLDNINYVIDEDPILVLNSICGYGSLGVNVILPVSSKKYDYSRTIHEMTAYEDHLTRKE
jgi:hypothetical protein